MSDYSTIVVGAGIIGSWTAYHLAQQGVNTLLCDQFPLPHSRGSSHSCTRTFRMTLQDDMPYIRDAYQMWHKLQGDSKLDGLITRTGRLTFSYSDATFLLEGAKKLTEHSIEHQVLDSKQLAIRFPEIKYPDHQAIYEVNGSVLQAHKCLTAVQQQFVNLGGTIRDNLKVIDMQHGQLIGDKCTVTVVDNNTSCQSQITCDKLIVTAGAWAAKLVPELKSLLRPMTAAHTYWRVTKPGVYSVANGFPVISQTRERFCYGIPSFEYEDLMKIGPMYGFPCDPDKRDSGNLDKYVDVVRSYVKEHYPYLDSSQPVIVEPCIYTYTPDHRFIIDRLSIDRPNILIGAGFSADGFMGSPATGKLLALMSLDREKELPYDMELHRLSRFVGGKL